jgi:hypothetical protein
VAFCFTTILAIAGIWRSGDFFQLLIPAICSFFVAGWNCALFAQ